MRAVRRQVPGDRLLGPHRLAGAQGSFDQRRVAVRRSNDDDGLNVRVVDRVEGIGRGAARLRQLAAALGRFGHGIRDDDDAGVGDAGHGAEVGEAHATSAKHRDPDTALVSRSENSHGAAPTRRPRIAPAVAASRNHRHPIVRHRRRLRG